MRKDIMIAIALVIICLIGIILLAPKLKQDQQPAEQQPVEQSELEIEKESLCPEQLTIRYFVDGQRTIELSDDDVFIILMASGDEEYSAQVFVDGVLQGEAMVNEEVSVKSELITAWWRAGFQQEKDQSQEREDSVEEETDNQRTFIVSVFIEGCDEQISPLTPVTGTQQESDSKVSSRYSLDITKTDTQHMDD